MNREQLALAACEGLSDEDLVNRGECGFPKMIDRKRKYAATARMLYAENLILKKQLADAAEQLEQSKQVIAQLESLNVHVEDTTQAQALLNGLLSKGGDQ